MNVESQNNPKTFKDEVMFNQPLNIECFRENDDNADSINEPYEIQLNQCSPLLKNGNLNEEISKSQHNSTSSSGYGLSLSTDSSSTSLSSSQENSLTNPNDSVNSIPNTPRTPNFMNCIPNKSQNISPNKFIDTIQKMIFDNTMFSNVSQLSPLNITTIPGVKKHTNIDRGHCANYDPFNDYTGIDKVMNSTDQPDVYKTQKYSPNSHIQNANFNVIHNEKNLTKQLFADSNKSSVNNALAVSTTNSNSITDELFTRRENDISISNHDYEDDVFTTNNSINVNYLNNNNNILNEKYYTGSSNLDTLTFFKKLLASTNSDKTFNFTRNVESLPSEYVGYNDNIRGIQNQISTTDTKSRHYSLLSSNKFNFNGGNFTSKPENQINFNSSQYSLAPTSTKKRTNSFGLNTLVFNQGNVSNINNTNNHNDNSVHNSHVYTTMSNGNTMINNSQNLSHSYITNINNNSSFITKENNFLGNVSITQPISVTQSQLSNANNKPLRSERLPTHFIEDIIKQAKLRRKGGGKKEVCVFCRNNGEKEQIYTSHTLKDAANRVSCPILRLYQCPICHASADNAHTIKYCPYAEKDNGSIKLFKDSRMNTAVLLMNSLANSTPVSSSPTVQQPQQLNKQTIMNISNTYNSANNNSTNLSLTQTFHNMTVNRSPSDSNKASNLYSAFNLVKMQ